MNNGKQHGAGFDKTQNMNSAYLLIALYFIILFSIFARAPLTAVCFVDGLISRIDNRTMTMGELH